MAGTVALDVLTAATPGTGDFSFTHTPSGTPKGVLIAAAQDLGTTDESVSAPVYGGVTIPLVTPTSGANPLISTAGAEDSVVYLWFKGSGIPTGAQTVTWDVNATGSVKTLWVVTFTASGDIEIVSAAAYDADAAANVNALSFAAGSRTCFMCAPYHHALNAIANLTAPSGWTKRGEHDYGSAIAGLATKDANASGTVGASFSTTANVRMAAWQVCLDEVSGLSATVGQSSETDTAQAMTRVKRRALGQPSTTGTAQAISRGITKAVGQASSSATAGAITPSPIRRLVGQASTTGVAQPITWAPKKRIIGQAVATDTAQAITATLVDDLPTLAIGVVR